jgi:hypothetical protein
VKSTITKKPGKTARKLLALSPDLDDRLRNACLIAGVSVNHAINQLIEQWVDQVENQAEQGAVSND